MTINIPEKYEKDFLLFIDKHKSEDNDAGKILRTIIGCNRNIIYNSTASESTTD